MSQSVGLATPLSSNNRANINTPLGGGGTQLAGVESLNSQSGNLAIVGDASIGISAIGSGQLQVSTAGKPQVVGAISSSGAIVAAGALTSAGVTTGGVTCTLLACNGPASITSVTGNLPVSGILSAPTINGAGMTPSVPIPIIPANNGASGTYVIAGMRYAWGVINNGALPTLDFTAGVPAAFASPPIVIAVPLKYGPAVGFATVISTAVANCSLQLTTSGGTGFATSCNWMAFGPAA